MRRSPHLGLPEEAGGTGEIGWSHPDITWVHQVGVEVERCEEEHLAGGAEVQRCSGEEDLRCSTSELWSLEEWYSRGRLVAEAC